MATDPCVEDPALPGGAVKPSLRIRSYGRSDIGRHRRGNEDAYFNDDDLGLYVVADGMGGHAAGEIASNEAINAVIGMVRRGLATMSSSSSGASNEARGRAARRLMEGAIQAATYMVFAIGELEREKAGMGTTISAAFCFDGALVTGQVGDSRIYQIRDGATIQLTEDHTLIAWQIKQGLLTAEDARHAPHRNVITRAVGNKDYVEVDTSIVPMLKGDRYLLCSDGLHQYLKEDEVTDIAALGGERAVDRFIELANEAGGRDNITAILVEVD